MGPNLGDTFVDEFDDDEREPCEVAGGVKGA